MASNNKRKTTMAKLNRERFQAFQPDSEDGLQAAFAFNGDVYLGLRARELDRKALSWAQDHVRITCFMTDGQVGDDMEIIAEVQKHPHARVFAMGFGSSPNRFLPGAALRAHWKATASRSLATSATSSGFGCVQIVRL